MQTFVSIGLIHDTSHLCTHFRIGWDKSNVTWYFRGQTSANLRLPIRVIAVEFVYSLKT